MLLDTCAFFWLVAEPRRLSPAARRAIDDPAKSLHLSDASVWELCLKWFARRIRLPSPPRVCIPEQVQRWSLKELRIERGLFYRATELPDLHRDPFDRLLVAQAIETGLTIVTPDEAVRAYPVATLW